MPGAFVNFADFWYCVLEVLRSCASFFALLCYVPCLVVCLVHIRRLDNVAEIRADTQRLKDMKAEVEIVALQIRGEAERQALIQAVQDRMLGRIDLVNAFFTHVMQNSVRENPQELVKATKLLVQCLTEARDCLGPPEGWLMLSTAERVRRACVFEIKRTRYVVCFRLLRAVILREHLPHLITGSSVQALLLRAALIRARWHQCQPQSIRAVLLYQSPQSVTPTRVQLVQSMQRGLDCRYLGSALPDRDQVHRRHSCCQEAALTRR